MDDELWSIEVGPKHATMAYDLMDELEIPHVSDLTDIALGVLNHASHALDRKRFVGSLNEDTMYFEVYATPAFQRRMDPDLLPKSIIDRSAPPEQKPMKIGQTLVDDEVDDAINKMIKHFGKSGRQGLVEEAFEFLNYVVEAVKGGCVIASADPKTNAYDVMEIPFIEHLAPVRPDPTAEQGLQNLLAKYKSGNRPG